MALSDHERRVLEDIERQLANDDPRFFRRASETGSQAQRQKRLRLSAAAFVVGLLTMFVGLTVHAVVGFVGFVVMFGAVVVGAQALRTGFRDERRPLGDRLRQSFPNQREND